MSSKNNGTFNRKILPKSFQRKPWRKNLYENTDYEDNYTDPSFLKDLRTNLNVRFFTFQEAICGITIVNNQISSITGFLIIFYILNNDAAAPTTLFVPSVIATTIGYLLYRGKTLSVDMIIEDSKTLLTVLLFGYIFAPLLHTLTEAISTDTIFITTTFVMMLNLVFYDYGLSVAMVSKAISVNAAIFGAICLASRLSTSYHAFVLLVEAAIIFVLYPMLTTRCWRWYFFLPIFLNCCYFLYYISKVIFYTYLIISLFINFICPSIFVTLQRYKNNIHGPWDEAIVEENVECTIEQRL
ncbi:phosphatidylinositol N-acetylglucosaminyltransferase subunit C [Teleopsis dalmanni]|uniref:phosphatidylinositol N-acetylglucosaminyltransferase subunit C n=1 Tax=Teleopsis dalmanni TaxID=139649 RepID=UPI0018CDD3CD|nr:phosphatidylinositol N-acetylglucosaminyltransferase subunit C [Teleopsis dalmanni]